jgi:hypothetical protein
MKPFIISLVFTLTTSYAFSQKVRVGIVGGPYFSSSTRENVQVNNRDTSKDHARSIQGLFSYFGGFVVSVPIGKHIIFKPQIEYVVKGWRARNNFVGSTREDFSTKTKANCIDLPLNFVYNVPTRDGRFFIGAGPYFSYALSGKVYNVKNTGINYSLTFNSSDTSSTAYPTNRFDIGGTLIAGYEFRNGLFCTLHYAHGFRDFRIELDNATDPHNKNVGVGLGIGYMFK